MYLRSFLELSVSNYQIFYKILKHVKHKTELCYMKKKQGRCQVVSV